MRVRRAQRLVDQWQDFIEPEPNSGCWLWIACCNGNGYGRIRVDGKTVPVHRFVYELFHEKVPAHLDMDHLCRVPRCVNPNHLEPVTHRINTLRGNSPSAACAKKTYCVHGHSLEDAYIISGKRKCRICSALIMRKWRMRRIVDSAR